MSIVLTPHHNGWILSTQQEACVVDVAVDRLCMAVASFCAAVCSADFQPGWCQGAAAEHRTAALVAR